MSLEKVIGNKLRLRDRAKIGVDMFGSLVSGLGTGSSDADFALRVPESMNMRSLGFSLKRALGTCPEFSR